jgi:hypothetical protein
VAVMRSLAHDPLNPNAAREAVCALQVTSYIDFEEMLLATPHNPLEASGSSLGTLTGTFRLDVVPAEPP